MRRLAACVLLALQVAPAGAQFWGAASAPGIPYPLDNLPRPAAAYGMVRLLSSYTANKAVDLTLVNGSTTTATLGFINGVVDQATGDAFCAPSPTTCYVTKAYDQSSNGCDASQATLADAPVWSAANAVSGIRPIVFNSIAHTTTGLTANTKWLTASCPSWIAGNPSTLVFAGQSLHSRESRIVYEDAADVTAFMTAFNGFPPEMLVQNTGTQGVTPAEVEPSVLIYNWASGIMTTSSNDQSGSYALAAGAAKLGANIGSSDATAVSNMDMLAAALYTRPIAPAQVATIRAALASALAIQQSFANVVVNEGDSMSSGEGSLFDNSALRFALPLLKYPVRAYLNAVFGASLGTQGLCNSSDLTTEYQSGYASFIVEVMGGENDIRNSESLSTIEADLKSCINTLHALGPNVKVILGVTPMQCGWSGAMLTEYQQYATDRISLGTTAQAQGGFGADAVADYTANATIGTPGQNFVEPTPFCNATVSPDGNHPTDFAQQIMGAIEAAAVNALLH